MSGPDATPTRVMSWEELGERCRELALAAAARGGYGAVVGIALGGSIVGATVASLLRLDYYPIRLSRRVMEMGKNTRRVIVPPTRDLAGRDVLLCDDVSRTGDTFKIALHELRQVGARSVTTAALVRMEGGYAPDLAALTLAGPLLFPWEQEYLRDGRLVRRG